MKGFLGLPNYMGKDRSGTAPVITSDSDEMSDYLRRHLLQ